MTGSEIEYFIIPDLGQRAGQGAYPGNMPIRILIYNHDACIIALDAGLFKKAMKISDWTMSLRQ